MNSLPKKEAVPEEIGVNLQFYLLKMFLLLKSMREIKHSAIGLEVKETSATYR